MTEKEFQNKLESGDKAQIDEALAELSENLVKATELLRKTTKAITDTIEEPQDTEALDPNDGWLVWTNPSERAIHSDYLNIDIAPTDYYEINADGDTKTHFTWDEAMEIADKVGGGWRLPTRHEWVMICEEFAMGNDGDLKAEKLQDELGLIRGGFKTEADAQFGFNACGCYWSSTDTSDTGARALCFYKRLVEPQNNDLKRDGLSVRLVRSCKNG